MNNNQENIAVKEAAGRHKKKILLLSDDL